MFQLYMYIFITVYFKKMQKSIVVDVFEYVDLHVCYRKRKLSKMDSALYAEHCAWPLYKLGLRWMPLDRLIPRPQLSLL